MRILLVEDDEIIAETLGDLLAAHYSVDAVATGKQALASVRNAKYDLMVLDLGLPDITGQEVCKTIRAEGNSTPIIILTGRDELQHKVAALDLGADDYMVKPFKFPELTARIRAILRRNPLLPALSVIEYGDIVLNPTNRTVMRQGTSIKLRRKEFDLLEYMLRNQGLVLTRTMILDHVWDNGGAQFSNIVDVHVKYLRDRVERPFKAPFIKTVHGLGYTILS